MADLPITQVGRIDGLEIGTPSIRNTAQGVSAETIKPILHLGVPSVFHVEYSGWKTDFNFILDVEKYPQRFLFEGVIIQTKIGLGDQSVVGTATVSKGAQTARPSSLATDKYGIPSLRFAGNDIDFNFDSDGALNAEPYFHFGETYVITQVGNISPPEFVGVEDTNIAFIIAPEGIFTDYKTIHQVFDGSGSAHALDFNFNYSSDLDYVPGQRVFIFDGPQLVIQVGAGDGSNVGEATEIRNAAQGVRVDEGIAPKTRVGLPVFYPTREKPDFNIPLDISLNQRLRSSNPLNVPFYFYFDYEVPVQGAYMSAYGTPVVRNDRDILLPVGFDVSGLGALKVEVGANSDTRINLEGFDSSEYGWSQIDLKTLFIDGLGFNSQAHGKPRVEYGTFYAHTEGVLGQSFGSQMISHYLRTLTTGSGIYQFDTGLPWMSYGQRELVTKSINPATVPVPTVGPKIVIHPEGIDATLFGERIIPESQTVYPQGFREVYGFPYVGNYTQYIRVNGLDQSTVGYVDNVYNLTQYITMYYFEESELNPPGWSKWLYVENRNKNPVSHGTFFQAFGRPQLDLKAAPIKVNGLETLDFGKHMVSDKIRILKPEPIENPPVSRWSAIHNAARVLDAKGFGPNDLYGKPGVLNTRRYYPYIGAIDSLEFGEPMIAYKIRELWIESRYSINPPQIPLPKLELLTRYIEVGGKDYYGTGGHHLEIRWNKITTRWAHRDFFGDVQLRKVTPEVYVNGANAEEWGEPAIRNEWEMLTATGQDMMLFGRALIEYRTKNVKPISWPSDHFGLETEVIKTASPPYTPQNIYLGPGSDTDTNRLPHYGIGYDREEDRFGRASVRGNVLWAAGFEASLYGRTTIHSNGILVEPGIFDHYFGEPWVSTTGRLIEPVGIPSQVHVSDNVLVTPFYIKPREVESEHVMGEPTVRHQHRKLNVSSFGTDGYGRPNVENSKRYLYPTGFTTQRIGWLVFPSTEILEAESVDNDAKFGTTTVRPPPYLGPQTIYPQGINGFSTARSYIELLHREIQIKGFDYLTMGYSRGPLNPYMWQSLRIGPYIPTAIGGYYATLFGKAWISNWVREVGATGFDTFLSEYDYTRFDKRMRVTRDDSYGTVSQAVVASGFEDLTIGVPDVRLSVHYIRPDGNSDQFRKGAINPIKNAAEGFYIKPSGVMVARIGIAQVRYAETGPLNLNLEWEQHHFDGDFNF